MKSDFIPILENIGLSEKEAKVYLALLSIGESAVSEIAKQAKLNRVTTYDILKKLSEKSLTQAIIRDNKLCFSAIKPHLLANQAERHVKALKSILPALNVLSGEAPSPKVQYFRGLEGVKYVYEDTLTSSTEILNFSNSTSIKELWPHYDEEYVQERVKRKIFLRGILPDNEAGRITKSLDSENFREFRLVSHEEFTFTNEINIYDEKIAITSFCDELIGIIIESKEIAQTQRDIFKMAWQWAKKN